MKKICIAFLILAFSGCATSSDPLDVLFYAHSRNYSTMEDIALSRFLVEDRYFDIGPRDSFLLPDKFWDELRKRQLYNDKAWISYIRSVTVPYERPIIALRLVSKIPEASESLLVEEFSK